VQSIVSVVEGTDLAADVEGTDLASDSYLESSRIAPTNQIDFGPWFISIPSSVKATGTSASLCVAGDGNGMRADLPSFRGKPGALWATQFLHGFTGVVKQVRLLCHQVQDASQYICGHLIAHNVFVMTPIGSAVPQGADDKVRIDVGQVKLGRETFQYGIVLVNDHGRAPVRGWTGGNNPSQWVVVDGSEIDGQSTFLLPCRVVLNAQQHGSRRFFILLEKVRSASGPASRPVCEERE
jgi:hypothetical protein